MAEKLNIFHIQFEEVLQEKLLLKTERKVGPEFEEDSEDEQAAKQELEELAIQANVKVEEENTKKQVVISLFCFVFAVVIVIVLETGSPSVTQTRGQ